MRGLFFLWRVCGCASLKLPALGREPATKESYGNGAHPGCVTLPTDGPPLAPSRNVGVIFWILLLQLTDLIDRGAVRPVALVGRHE
jgi:hypothetical protein